MTRFYEESPQQSVMFTHCFETLTDEMGLAAKWNRAFIILIINNSVAQRTSLQSATENFLVTIGQKVIRRELNNGFAQSHQADQNLVYFLEGSQKTNSISPAIQGMDTILQQQQNADRPSLVFWLTANEARELVHLHPHIWTSRQCSVEFDDSDESDQILNESLEAEWREAGARTSQPVDKASEMGSPATGPDSRRASLFLELGILNWRKSEFEKAEGLIRRAIELAPIVEGHWFEAECLNALALVQSSTGQFENAIESYKDAIRLAPRQILAWNNLGNMCLKAGRNDQAMIAYQKAIEHNPQDPVAWNGLGNVFGKAQYFDDAIHAYKKAIEFSPSLPHPWNGLGNVFEACGEMDKAIQALQMSIKLDGQRAAPWLKLAHLYQKNPMPLDAIKAFHQALKIEPENSLAWNELGAFHIQCGSYEDAIQPFETAIQIDRSFGQAHYNLGIAMAGCGRHEQAITALQNSIDCLATDKEKSEGWNRLAESYRWLNQYDKALVAYQEADNLKFANRPAPQNNAALAASVSAEVSSAEDSPLDQNQSTDSLEPAIDAQNVQAQELPAHPTTASVDAHESAISPDLDSTEISPTIPLQEGSADMQFNLFSRSQKQESTAGLKFQQGKEFGFPRRNFGRPDRASSDEWNEKGNSLFQIGDYKEAAAAYRQALEADPSAGRPYANLALTFSLLGHYADAIQLYQSGIALLTSDKEKAVCWNELGNIYRCLSQYDNAAAAYQKADVLDPDATDSSENSLLFSANPEEGNENAVGQFFFHFDTSTESEDALRKAAELEPASAVSYNTLALVKTAQKKYGEAIPLFQKSIDLFKENRDKADAWNHLGDVYRKLNNYDNAISAYQTAIKLNHGSSSLATRARLSLLGNCFID